MEHKNAEVIKAWADGKTIQFQNWINHQWEDYKLPESDDIGDIGGPWDSLNCNWRIKPKEPEVEVKYASVGVFEHHGKQLHFIGSCNEHLIEDEYITDRLDQDWEVIAQIRLTTDAETGKILAVELMKE